METNENNQPLVLQHNEGLVISTYDFGLGKEETQELDPNEPHPNFIESNTNAITLEDLTTKCIVPTFADMSLTISHQSGIACICKAAESIWGELTPVEIRVSHPIHGRTHDALYLKESELKPEQKTLFYQRMAFIAHVKGMTRNICGQEVMLTIGATRSYHEDKLYGRKSPMKWQLFCDWAVRCCSNQLVLAGYGGTVECLTEADLYQQAYLLFSRFAHNQEDELHTLENLNNTVLPEDVLCSIWGRLRLYQFLTTEQKTDLPEVILGDQIINNSVKQYCSNPNFGKKEGEEITCWNLAQYLTEGVKAGSYIDRFAERMQNALTFSIGIQKALAGDPAGLAYRWFLQ